MEWLYIRGRLAARRLHWFMLLTVGALVGVFVAATLTSTSVGARAVWSGQSISNDGILYSKITDTQTLSALGVSYNTDVYGFLNSSASPKVMQTIQMPAGSPSDQPITARLVFYNFTPPNTYTQQSSSDIAVQVDTSTSGASCNVDGVGWIVCSLSNWLAAGMDSIYHLLADLMKTPTPKQDDPRDSIRMAWEIMRNIANAAFVIMFIIIIYSHITSLGVSNYGIKKILPRLIIAAIAMNLSLVICVFFIDISNILGIALQDMFNGIRDNLITNATNTSGNVTTWSDITTLVLAGGASVVATGGVITSGTPLLLPLLLLMMLAMVMVFIVLAARQALIVILTIVSPIAFALYLLPGTEKWFEKWRETMFTMLLFFPAFAVVFGGAQLAGTVILMMPNVSLIAILLGLAVQVAPLAIAPLVMKLGGGVLNRLAGVINNPSKGLIDKSKQWADEQSEAIKLKRWAAADKRIFGKDKNGGRRKAYNIFGMGRRAMRGFHRMGETRKKNLETLRKGEENSMRETRRFQNAELLSQQASRYSSIIEQEAANRYAELETYDPELANWKDAPNKVRSVAEQARSLAQRASISGMRSESLKRVQHAQLAANLKDSEALRRAVGDLEDIYFEATKVGKNLGSQRALAAAAQISSSNYEESVKNATAILNGSNVSDFDTIKLLQGNAVGDIMATDDIRNAAGRKIATGKNAAALLEMLNTTQFDDIPDSLAQELGVALKDNGAKPFWLGGSESANIQANTVKDHGIAFKVRNMISALQQGKLSADKIVTQDVAYLQDAFNTIRDNGIVANLNADQKGEIIRQIELAMADPLYKGRVGERRGVLQSIYSLFGGQRTDIWT